MGMLFDKYPVLSFVASTWCINESFLTPEFLQGLLLCSYSHGNCHAVKGINALQMDALRVMKASTAKYNFSLCVSVHFPKHKTKPQSHADAVFTPEVPADSGSRSHRPSISSTFSQMKWFGCRPHQRSSTGLVTWSLCTSSRTTKRL